MQYSVLLDRLQKLTNQNITQAELCRVLKQNQKDLEFAKQNAWQVPEGYFEKIRSQITKNPTSVKMQGLRKEDLLLEE